MVWWQLLVCVCIASGHITYLFEAKTRGTKPASISPLPSLKFSPNFFSLNLKIMFEVNVYYLALLEKSKNFTYFQNYWFDFHLLCGKMITYLEVTSIRVLYISNLFPLCHILIRLFKFLVQNNNWYPTALVCKWNYVECLPNTKVEYIFVHVFRHAQDSSWQQHVAAPIPHHYYWFVSHIG